MRPRSVVASVALVAATAAAAGACGGGSDARPGPRVDLIEDAIAAVEAHYGSPQDYFEISAALDEVRVIIAVDDATAAEVGGLTADGGFIVPESAGPAEGSTFTADAVTFERSRIFSGIRDELDDPTIIDFAIQGGPGGAVVYDATVASESGGVLLVLLASDGTVLGAQAS